MAPSLKETKKTLYVGEGNYKIAFKNKSSKATVSYKSSNTKVATVTKSGNVKPIKAGKATVTATVKQDKKNYNLKLTIEVKKPFVELTSTTEYLNTGETFLFKAKTYGMKDKVVWSVSDDKIASIGLSGKLTALTPGDVTVTATAGKVKSNWTVIIGSNRLGTFAKDITCSEDKLIYISRFEPIEGEKLTATSLSGSLDIVAYDWGDETKDLQFPLTIKPKKSGTETIIITTDKTTDRLYLNITVP